MKIAIESALLSVVRVHGVQQQLVVMVAAENCLSSLILIFD